MFHAGAPEAAAHRGWPLAVAVALTRNPSAVGAAISAYKNINKISLVSSFADGDFDALRGIFFKSPRSTHVLVPVRYGYRSFCPKI